MASPAASFGNHSFLLSHRIAGKPAAPPSPGRPLRKMGIGAAGAAQFFRDHHQFEVGPRPRPPCSSGMVVAVQPISAMPFHRSSA